MMVWLTVIHFPQMVNLFANCSDSSSQNCSFQCVKTKMYGIKGCHALTLKEQKEEGS